MCTNTIRAPARLVAVCLLGALSTAAVASHKHSNVIIEWNALAQKTTVGPPFPQARIHAMMHIAMADAVVAIEDRYEPFQAEIKASHWADTRAAAAQAAHDILLAFHPDQKDALASALTKSLKGIPEPRRSEGRRVGSKAATKILAWRQFDGFAGANPMPSLLPSQLPGIWRETGSGPALFAAFGDVTPMGLLTATQFLPAVNPQLESTEYADDYNEVKSLGEIGSTTRTEYQTRIASLIGSPPGPYNNVTNPLRIWHNVVADAARSKSLSLVETARLFALVMVSIHDSLQTSHASKFTYRLWRPVTAVAYADVDGNDATEAQSGWVPLIGTPPYPSHASNAACIGTGAARMLANVLGKDNIPFTATWYASNDENPAVVYAQPYGSFSAFAHDFGSSRVWGGIHFRFEIDASEHSCTQVADYLYDNYMQRKRSKH